MNKYFIHAIVSFGAALVLAACGSSHQSLYYWSNYGDNVYHYLTSENDSINEQISQMEQYFADVARKKQAIAPGAHAHMGLLLLKVGQINDARQQFEQEKQLFPESSQFMDFLLKTNGVRK